MPEMMNDISEPETAVPNLMKVGEIPINIDVDNDTETLDPVVNNNNFCRFVLSNKGFLHSGSKIQLCVDIKGKNYPKSRPKKFQERGNGMDSGAFSKRGIPKAG